jgi:hypothetical protein
VIVDGIVTRRALLLIASLGLLLILSVLYASYVWFEMGDVAISWHGVVAMVLGVVLSFLVGAGLMALVFYSNRKGFDDEV